MEERTSAFGNQALRVDIKTSHTTQQALFITAGMERVGELSDIGTFFNGYGNFKVGCTHGNYIQQQ